MQKTVARWLVARSNICRSSSGDSLSRYNDFAADLECFVNLERDIRQFGVWRRGGESKKKLFRADENQSRSEYRPRSCSPQRPINSSALQSTSISEYNANNIKGLSDDGNILSAAHSKEGEAAGVALLRGKGIGRTWRENCAVESFYHGRASTVRVPRHILIDKCISAHSLFYSTAFLGNSNDRLEKGKEGQNEVDNGRPIFTDLEKERSESLPWRARSTRQSVDEQISICNELPEFHDCMEYLASKLEKMKKTELKKRLAKVCCTGFTWDGLPFSLEQPVPPNLEMAKNVINFLEKFPGINLTRAFANSPHAIMHPLATSKFSLEERAEQFSQELALSNEQMAHIFNRNFYFLFQGSLKIPRSKYQAGTELSSESSQNRAITSNAADLLVDSSPLYRSHTGEIMVLNNELSAINCVKVIATLNFDRDELRSIILKAPKLLSARPERIQAGIQQLYDVGMNKNQARTAVWKLPTTLYTSPEKIAAILDWLKLNNLTEEEAISTLANFPHLLSYNQLSNIGATVDYLKKDLGISQESLGDILRYAPDLLGRSISRIKSNFSSFENAGVRGEYLSKMIAKSPGLLRLDVSKPPYSYKLKFLKEVLGRDVGPALATNPMYLTYGLERILSRHAFLLKHSKPDYALTSWLSASNLRFATKYIQTSLEEWLEFLEDWRKKPENISLSLGKVGDAVVQDA